MSEEQQKNATQGAPIGTQRSGSNGERRDRGTDELSPKGEASECSASRRVSRETSETPPQNRPSSAYLYLLILFGAAFLMLLLAYFVQQRNNETTISGLQDSWNLSREELMEENQLLTEKNEELEVRLAVMEDQRDRAYRQIDELEKQYNDAAGLGHLLDTELQCWHAFWGLETSFQEENYEDCAEFFHLAYYSNYPHIPETESAQRRARLIYETLLELGYLAEDDPAVFVP